MIGAAIALTRTPAVPLPSNAIAVTLAFEPLAPAIPPPAPAPSPTPEPPQPEVVASPPENPPPAASELPETPAPPPPEPSTAAPPEPAPAPQPLPKPSASSRPRAEPLVQAPRPPPRTRAPPDVPSAAASAPTIGAGQPQRQSSPGPVVDQQAFAPLIPPRPVSGVASNRKPNYPIEARSRRQQGRVLLRVQVSAVGTATAVEVVSSSGHPMLDQAARAAVQTWHFIPATRAGAAVPAQVEVPIEFRMDD